MRLVCIEIWKCHQILKESRRSITNAFHIRGSARQAFALPMLLMHFNRIAYPIAASIDIADTEEDSSNEIARGVPVFMTLQRHLKKLYGVMKEDFEGQGQAIYDDIPLTSSFLQFGGEFRKTGHPCCCLGPRFSWYFYLV